MEVTSENYFDGATNKEYLSVSTAKAIMECESSAFAALHKGYKKKSIPAFAEGHFLHAWNEGSLDKVKMMHPEMFKKDGTLYAKFTKIYDTIDFIEKDKQFMFALSGKKETIFTGELFGCKFKIMVDSLNIENGFFTDLKFMRSIREKKWDEEKRMKVNFIEKYNYILQMAVYQEIIRQNVGVSLEPYIAAVDKAALSGNVTDKELISFKQEELNQAVEELRTNIERIKKVWKGEIKEEELKKCGECDYCKSQRKIIKPVHWLDI